MQLQKSAKISLQRTFDVFPRVQIRARPNLCLGKLQHGIGIPVGMHSSREHWGARIRALILLIAVAFAAAMTGIGCGASEDSKDAASAPRSSYPPSSISVTRAQFVAHTDEICDKSWEKISKRLEAYRREERGSGTSPRQLFAHSVGDVYLPYILFWYDHINALERPKGDDRQIERMLAVLESTAIAALKRPYRFHSPAQISALYERSNRLVRRYGITSCVVTRRSFLH